MKSTSARTLLAFALVLPLALGAEIVALLELVLAPRLDGLHGLALVGLHLFSAVAFAEALTLRYPAEDPGADSAWRLGLVLALGLPLFGALLVAIVVLRPPRTIRVKLDDLVSPMEYRKQQAEAQLAAEADHGVAGVAVEAIGEALKDQDKDKRLGAVEALRALENREAVAMLGQSLKNTVFEVRFHAVEALAGINKKHSDRIAQATAALERDPTPDNRITLADVYHDYASLEAEEESIQQHLYRSAVNSYREAMSQGAQLDLRRRLQLAAGLVRTGSLQQAWHTYPAALELDPESYQALLGVAKLQFRQGQFDQLRGTCRRMLDLAPSEIEHPEVLQLWTGGPADLRPQGTLDVGLGSGGRR